MGLLAKKNTDAKPAKKPKKVRRSPAKYVKDVFAELKKVTWPTRKELLTNTGAVIAFIVLMAAVIGLMDLGLSELFLLLVE